MEHAKIYEELFERSPDAFLIIEGDRFVACNPAAVRMLRFPDEASLLRRYGGGDGSLSAHPAEMSPACQPDGRDSYEKATEILDLVFERGSHTFEWMHECADGSPLLVEVQLTAVRGGDKPRLHVVWRDIAERKRMEAELHRAQRLEAVGRLAGGVAHDFANLLSVIIGHAESLQDKADLRDGRRHAAGILDAADHAARLTHRLLAFSRGQPTRFQATDLGKLVQQLGAILHRLIGEHISLNIECHEEPLVVYADPAQLEQVVMNLAVNSRDAMPQGGKIDISVSRRQVNSREPVGRLPTGTYVCLRVSDTGAGMTSEQITHAFDPFYTTKAASGGTGLGLATVHAIADQSGGRASIESSPGHGTTVAVMLPLSDLEPAPQDVGDAEVVARGGHETILLVEDDDGIRELYETCLTDRGYRVLTARDGQDGLDQAAQWEEQIDMVISDVVMPRVGGPEMLRRLLISRPRIKVVLMSGYSQDQNLRLPVADDSLAILQKPFSPKTLLREVRRVLESG